MTVHNPFEVRVSRSCSIFCCHVLCSDAYPVQLALTQPAVRKRLADAEASEAPRANNIVVHENVSPAVFINTGLELEDAQFVPIIYTSAASNKLVHRRRLGIDRGALSPHPTNTQLAKLLERSNALQRKITAWMEIQQVYMPGASVLRERDERSKASKGTEGYQLGVADDQRDWPTSSSIQAIFFFYPRLLERVTVNPAYRVHPLSLPPSSSSLQRCLL